MRILHVLDHSLPVQSGYSFRSQAILREQRALGLQTEQITGPKHGARRAPTESVEGFEFHRANPGQGPLARLPVLNQLDVIRQLRGCLRSVIAATQPDLIHAHSPCLNALAAFGLGKPVVYELRSSWEDAAVSSGTTHEGSLRYRLSQWLETQVLLRADHVTTICEGLRAEAMRRGVDSHRITVVPNAVDADAFAAPRTPDPEVRRRLGLQDACVLGFIGSFFAWEGLPLLVEALPRIVAARPNVRLLLVGGGPDEANVRAAVERLQVGRYVVFAGQVPHAQVAALYQAVDILVYPRTPMRLTDMVTPLKPLEAMALAKVFIASDVGGHRELVRDRETGILFRAGDAAALAAAVLEVAGDAALRQRLMTAGPKYVRQERTWAQVVKRYVPAYDSLVRNAAGHAAEVRS
jgi:PEP-CTERM/exosortase A-associated glycosyltransferase